MDKATTFKVLEKSFTEEEWRFLIGQPVFIGLLAKEEWNQSELEGLIEAALLLVKRNNDLKKLLQIQRKTTTESERNKMLVEENERLKNRNAVLEAENKILVANAEKNKPKF